MVVLNERCDMMTVEQAKGQAAIDFSLESTWESKIGPEMLERLEDYLGGEFLEQGHVVPTVAGAAVYLGVNSEVLSGWVNHDRYGPHVARLLKGLKDRQELVLLSGGLSGRLNSTITKLVLSKHGYSDRVEHSALHEGGKNELAPAVFKGVTKDKSEKHDNPALGLVLDADTSSFKREQFKVERSNVTSPMEDMTEQPYRAGRRDSGFRDRWTQRLNASSSNQSDKTNDV